MKTCRDCVYFLAHRVTGYNCGYLLKRVASCNVVCGHFNHTESYRTIASSEEFTFHEEERFLSGGEGYSERIGRISGAPFQPDVSSASPPGLRCRIRELIGRYRDKNRKRYFWLKDLFEGRKRDSETRRRRERRNH